MKINRDNYEMYFLDYLEGNLPAEETAELLIFVEKNPDLRDLIEDNELITLVPDESINFLGKSAIKKYDLSSLSTSANPIPITSKTSEEFFIRFYENDLNESEKILLADYLKDNPSMIKDFELYGSTIIKPDLEIIYPFKSSLKRKTILLPNTKKVFTTVAIAASVLLFSTLFLKYNDQPAPASRYHVVAQTDTKKTISTSSNQTQSTSNQAGSSNLAGNRVSNNPLLASRLTQEESQNNSNQTSAAAGISDRINNQSPTPILNTRYSGDLALNQKQIPQSIERRTDFDGITSTAYYNSDPDATPLNSDGRVISGKLGYTLAQGISQAAGSIARDPEASRLLKGKISLSDIAGLGIKGYNLIANRNLSLNREYDSTGMMTGYALSEGDHRISGFPKRSSR